MSQNLKFSLANIDKERLSFEMNAKAKYYANVVHWTLIFALPLFWLIDFSFLSEDWMFLFAARVIAAFLSYLLFMYGTSKKDWWGSDLTMSLILGVYTVLGSIICAVVSLSDTLPFFMVLSVYFLLMNVIMFWKPIYALLQCLLSYLVIYSCYSLFNRYDSYHALFDKGGGAFFLLSSFSCLIGFNRYQLGKREIEKNVLIETANNRLLEQNEMILMQQIEIKEVNRKLQKLSEYRSDTMNIMMHDFRNFTGSIQMSLEMLGQNDDNLLEDQKEILGLIGLGNEKIKYLSEKLSKSSETFATDIEYNFEKIDFGKMIEKATFDIADAAVLKQVGLQLNVDPSENVVFLDRLFLEQVLTNLFSSIIRFSPSGTVLSVNVRKGEGNAIADIANVGSKMGKVKMDHLFNGLEEASHKNIYSSKSLEGFAIAKKLAEKMHGKLTYNSDDVIGNYYRLGFPLASI